MASAAAPEVTVLSVKLAKPPRERTRKLRQAEHRTQKDVESGTENKKVKKEVKEEVSKIKVKQEMPNGGRQEVKEENKIGTEKEEVKKEVRDVKEEVKEEVKAEAMQEVKEEGVKKKLKEEVGAVKQVKTEVKQELVEVKQEVKAVKHDVKQEDLARRSQTAGVKRELVEEGQLTWFVKQEEAEEAESVRPGKRRRISHKRPVISPSSFESRVPEWAEKCLAFQSFGKTWLPTKPCCPASPFLGLAAAPWEACKENEAKACVQRLSKVQFCEFRDFFHENPHHALFNDYGKDSSGSGPVEKAHGPKPEHFQDPAAKQHRAAEMMKMWPWMHDLPTRAWAGHGWLVEEDGMRRLSPTGGGSAMKGLEIFEAFGTVPEESPAAPGASVPTTSGVAGQVLTKKFRCLERQSGVEHISWHKLMACWQLSVREAGRRRNLNFPISKHMKEGLSEDEAVAAALAEAKAHREELVRQGKLQPPKPVTAKASGSTVRGVKYKKNSRKWQVQITNPRTKKLEFGGTFQTLAEAEAKARELAKKLGVQAEGEVVPVDRLAEAPHFEPLGPEKGVRWSPGEKAWHACCSVGGRTRNMRFRPKDLSEKEVEKAWKQAVAWRKQQEKERERVQRAPKR